MSQYSELTSLFKKSFSFDDILSRSNAHGFHCPYAESCHVRTEHEAMWTPAIGEEGTNVMIVGEAPSAGHLKGGQIAGKTDESNSGKQVQGLLRFVKKYFNTCPHFTDLIKCGAERQTKDDKKIFPSRITNCIKHFLLPEISIINPQTILCVGSLAFQNLSKLQKDGVVASNIDIVKLLHYGRQANLPLTPQDKEEYIWPFLLKKRSKADMIHLSFFNENQDEPDLL